MAKQSPSDAVTTDKLIVTLKRLVRTASAHAHVIGETAAEASFKAKLLAGPIAEAAETKEPGRLRATAVEALSILAKSTAAEASALNSCLNTINNIIESITGYSAESKNLMSEIEKNFVVPSGYAVSGTGYVEVDGLKSVIEIDPVSAQFFNTRIIGPNHLPDCHLVTIPAYASAHVNPQEILSIFQSENSSSFQGEVDEREFVAQLFHLRSIDDCVNFLAHEILRSIDPEIRKDLVDTAQEFASEIFHEHPIPIMNSPIKGVTLSQLAETGGFTVVSTGLLTTDPQTLVLHVLIAGSCVIVMKLSSAIGSTLSYAADYYILKLLNVPERQPGETRARTGTTRTRKRPSSKSKPSD